METRYTFLEPKTYDTLPDGRVRVYFDEQQSTESVTHEDPEGGEPTTDTYPVYTYRAADADSFTRNAIIVALIRAEYTADDELAIQRQQDDKPVEYATYSAYVEWCKVYADRIINGYTLETAKALKKAAVGQYDASADVRTFYVGEAPAWLSMNKRNNLRSSCESFRDAGIETVSFMGRTLPVDTALALLSQIECYAGQTTVVTEMHKAAIEALETIEAVEAYDYTLGYPEKLIF